MACDGLWKSFSSIEAITFVITKYKSYFKEKQFDNPKSIWARISDDLSAEAVLRGSEDNVSVILIIFKENIPKFFH